MPDKATSPRPSSSSPPPSHLVSLERRGDGAVIVRVRSEGPERLPDAVFTFRSGDPQYAYWLARLEAEAPRNQSAPQQ